MMIQQVITDGIEGGKYFLGDIRAIGFVIVNQRSRFVDDALEQGALFCNMLSLWQQHRQALGLPNEVMPVVHDVEAEEAAVPGISPRVDSAL